MLPHPIFLEKRLTIQPYPAVVFSPSLFAIPWSSLTVTNPGDPVASPAIVFSGAQSLHRVLGPQQYHSIFASLTTKFHSMLVSKQKHIKVHFNAMGQQEAGLSSYEQFPRKEKFCKILLWTTSNQSEICLFGIFKWSDTCMLGVDYLWKYL